MAASYQQDPTMNIKFGITYEHKLAEGIHEYGIQAFPTYILYTNNGSRVAAKIEGPNFESIQKAIASNGCKQDLGEGHSLGGGEVAKPLSASEARAQRLAMFEKKKAPEESIAVDQKDVTQETTDENTPMEVDAAAVVATTETEAVATATATAAKADEDVEMKDETETETKADEEKVKMIDPTANLSKDDLETLTGTMGFSLVRAQKGLLNGIGGVEGAVEWIMNHQDDADIDDPVPMCNECPPAGEKGVTAQSYKCNECGKILSNMANLELHANKTGHSDFEESTDAIKPLTAEEKAAKIAEIKQLLKAKRMEREAEEKVDHVERERQRRSMGQQMTKTREEMEITARKREAQQRKKEKEAFKKERARIRAELEKDKAERRAHKGKLQSKLGIDGYNPDAIQYDVGADGEQKPDVPPAKKKPKASVAKIDDYIAKVSAYRAGGDGGKCLKILLAYIKNILEKPDRKSVV